MYGPNESIVSRFTPKTKTIMPKARKTDLLDRFLNLAVIDSVITSNIFCKEEMPAQITAKYKNIANILPNLTFFKIVGKVTKSNDGPLLVAY